MSFWRTLTTSCAALMEAGGWYGGMPSADSEGEEVVLEMDRGAGLQAVT